MPRTITCPHCGEDEELTGRPGPDGIEIRCATCGATFPRDAALTCATCGGTDLVQRPRALTQYSRGTQLSITGWNQTLLCKVCDAAMLARSQEGKPIPPHYRPAAAVRRDPDAPDNTQITPR
jgi:transcription elongation factor Elf1